MVTALQVPRNELPKKYRSNLHKILNLKFIFKNEGPGNLSSPVNQSTPSVSLQSHTYVSFGMAKDEEPWT
jgi:hypothetical protein